MLCADITINRDWPDCINRSWATPYNPVQIDVPNRLLEPSLVHWLGSDHYGRDIFSRLPAGAHILLIMGWYPLAC